MALSRSLLAVLVLCACTAGAKKCSGKAFYEVTFESFWSRANTVRDYPSSAHWSPVVGAAHKKKFRLFENREPATRGLQDVAETGASGRLFQELDDARPLAGNQFNLGGLPGGSGKVSGMVKLNPNKRFVSAVTMMAPSPDWFAAVRANLCDTTTGTWKAKVVKNGKLYDAGTDSGVTFRAGNDATDPRGVVRAITETTGNDRYPFYNPGTPMPSLFEWTFELKRKN